MNDPLHTLQYCFEVIQEQRFAGTNQNPCGVRDLLYSAIRGAETEINRLRRELAEARAAAQPSSNLPRASSAGAMGGAVMTLTLELLEEIEKLKADNARLREALAPFGRVAERDVGESKHDNDRFVPITPKNVRSQVLYVRDFRRAREAMETSNGNP
jgi:hypothetical protein